MVAAASSETGLVLVTGASSGIGEALAREFARHGHSLVLVGRSGDRLTSLTDLIAAETGRRPVVITADLAQRFAGRNLAAALAAPGLKPKFIVNSAGGGLFGYVERLSIDEQIALIDLNCTALTEITLMLLPDAIAQRGGVLNVGSVAGFFPGPGMAIYFATKAYVQSFSQGLRAEYNDGRLRVTALCPGPVPTRFQARAGMIAPKMPRLLYVDIERVARAGYSGLLRNRAVVVPGLLNSLMAQAGGALYHRVCTPFVRRFHFGKPRQAEPFKPLAATDRILTDSISVAPVRPTGRDAAKP